MREEEKVEMRRQRAAFLAGAKYGYESVVAWHQGKVEAESKVRYPIVTTEVHVERDPVAAYEWGVIDGNLSVRWVTRASPRNVVGNWYSRDHSTLEHLWVPTKERVALWARLYANPSKEISE